MKQIFGVLAILLLVILFFSFFMATDTVNCSDIEDVVILQSFTDMSTAYIFYQDSHLMVVIVDNKFQNEIKRYHWLSAEQLVKQMAYDRWFIPVDEDGQARKHDLLLNNLKTGLACKDNRVTATKSITATEEFFFDTFKVTYYDMFPTYQY